MTITLPNGTVGFSEKQSGLASKRSSNVLNPPLICCEARSGLVHFIPSLAPWGCVVPMELLSGAPIFVDSLRVVVVVNEFDFKLGDKVRVQWQALGDAGKSYTSPSQSVIDFISLYFVVSDEIARQFEGETVEVIFVIERVAGDLPSGSLIMALAPALIQTGPIFIEGVSEGVLKIDQHPDGVTLTIPKIEHLRTNNAIEMTWRSDWTNAQVGPWRDYQRKLAVSPESPLKFRIKPSVYQGHRGHSIHLFCSLFLGSGMVPGITYGMGPPGTLELKLV
jgi:hypothetical protein